jgi:hypothetical protein
VPITTFVLQTPQLTVEPPPVPRGRDPLAGRSTRPALLHRRLGVYCGLLIFGVGLEELQVLAASLDRGIFDVPQLTRVLSCGQDIHMYSSASAIRWPRATVFPRKTSDFASPENHCVPRRHGALRQPQQQRAQGLRQANRRAGDQSWIVAGWPSYRGELPILVVWLVYLDLSRC